MMSRLRTSQEKRRLVLLNANNQEQYMYGMGWLKYLPISQRYLPQTDYPLAPTIQQLQEELSYITSNKK